MNNQIQQYRNKLERQKGKKEQIEKSISNLQHEIREKQRDLHRHEQAREIVKTVGLSTQQQLQFHISNITSLALESVFDDPYKLQVEFIQKHNKTECELRFVRDDMKIKPLDASGFGAVDVAAFALRIASWSMQNPHSRNVMILDEPFKHLKGEQTNLRLLDMIKEISKKLNLQIIMISDERVNREDIEEKADKVFEVTIKKGISQLKIVK
jgi:DNA repair exonuclease SbcCD ATPase subunit